MINRLNEKLAEFEFFSPNQQGFTKQKSTQTATEKVLNEVKNCKKRKKIRCADRDGYQFGVRQAELDARSSELGEDRHRWLLFGGRQTTADRKRD